MLRGATSLSSWLAENETEERDCRENHVDRVLQLALGSRHREREDCLIFIFIAAIPSKVGMGVHGQLLPRGTSIPREGQTLSEQLGNHGNYFAGAELLATIVWRVFVNIWLLLASILHPSYL